MRKLVLIFIVLFLIPISAFAIESLGGGLSGYSSSSLGSSGLMNTNSYQRTYDYSCPQVQSNLGLQGSKHIPYSAYSNYSNMSAAEQVQRNQELKRIYGK